MGSIDIPKRQRAAVKVGSGSDAKAPVQEVDVQMPGPEQILVKINWTGLCASDKSLLHDEWASFGVAMKDATKGIAGHEGAGTVVAVGDNMGHKWKVGDRAGIKWVWSTCGECEFCLNGTDELHCPKQINSGFTAAGTFSQYCVSDGRYTTRIPEGVTDEEAGPIMCGGVTAYTACKRSAVKPGQWIVLPGAGGGLGHFAVQYAKAMGMRVIAIDGGSEKGELCKKLGAEQYIDFTTTSDITAEVMRITTYGAHAVLVTAATKEAYASAPGLLRPGGTVVAVGLPKDPTVMAGAPPIMLCLKRLNIVGSVTGTLKDVEEALDFTARGLVHPILTKGTLDDVDKYCELMIAGKLPGRAVLKIRSWSIFGEDVKKIPILLHEKLPLDLVVVLPALLMDLHTSTSPQADPRVTQCADDAVPTSHSRQQRGGDVNPLIPRTRSNSLSRGDLEKAEVPEGPPCSSDNVYAANAGLSSSRQSQTRRYEYPNDLVDFDGRDDPENPKNFSNAKKWAITASMGWMTFVVTFASTVFSVAVEPVAEEYNISRVTATLGVSLFLLGFVLGPIVFGPASEAFGRRNPLFIGYTLFGIFQIPVAVARNVETIMLGRFLGGFFATAPLAIVGGALSDIWDPIPRAYAICCFASGAFTGPSVGPIVGGFLTMKMGWRWTAWITLIMTALFGVVGLVCIPETSAAKILQTKAHRLRHETKNWALHSKMDEDPLDARRLVTVYLVRPFVMLVQEPILALMTAYMSFLYGVLYLLFAAYPFSFHHERGWNIGVASLPFIAFAIGVFIGLGTMVWSTRTNFTRSYVKHGKAIPEERLPPMILGAIVLPIGMFWYAWSSNPDIIWVPQVLSSLLIGMGMLVGFWQALNYLIDVYGFYSNSALAINAMIRSVSGAVFPLFTYDMYSALGVPWATSLLAFLCVAFAPMPILFYYYGARIRGRSRFRHV